MELYVDLTLLLPRVESLAHVRESVQKKTFTRWANMSLNKEHKIDDLFEDLKTGVTLLKLINILSGSNLQPERGKYFTSIDRNCFR